MLQAAAPKCRTDSASLWHNAKTNQEQPIATQEIHAPRLGRSQVRPYECPCSPSSLKSNDAQSTFYKKNPFSCPFFVVDTKWHVFSFPRSPKVRVLGSCTLELGLVEVKQCEESRQNTVINPSRQVLWPHSWVARFACFPPSFTTWQFPQTVISSA